MQIRPDKRIAFVPGKLCCTGGKPRCSVPGKRLEGPGNECRAVRLATRSRRAKAIPSARDHVLAQTSRAPITISGRTDPGLPARDRARRSRMGFNPILPDCEQGHSSEQNGEVGGVGKKQAHALAP